MFFPRNLVDLFLIFQVPSPRCSPGFHRLHNQPGHLGRGVHLHRNDQRLPLLPRSQGRVRPTRQDLPSDWDPNRGPGVSRLPNYRPHKMCYYKAQRLANVWPRLHDAAFAESLGHIFLQPKASKRIGTDQALRHRYFSDLPPAIHDLDDEESVFAVPGVKLHLEDRSYGGHSVLKVAQEFIGRK